MLTTSYIACLSKPKLSASANASQVAIIVTPSIILLHIFADCPLPAEPQKTDFCPITSNKGISLLYIFFSPPTIKVKLPELAPITPPDTGASKKLMELSDAI